MSSKDKCKLKNVYLSINLLPWRELIKIKKGRRYKNILIASLMIILILVAAFYVYLKNIEYKERCKIKIIENTVNKNMAQEEKIARLQLLTEDYLSRINKINQSIARIDNSRKLIKIIDSNSPNKILIKELAQSEEGVMISGMASQQEKLDSFFMDVKKLDIFQNVKIQDVEVSRKNNLEVWKFLISAKYR